MSVTRAIKLLSVARGLIKNDFAGAAGVMGELHGLPQKIGQHLTLYNTRHSDEYFASLCTQSSIVELNIEQVLKGLGLARGEVELRAQASIGQVYRVTAADGPLAVKVKYPGVEKRIKNDFRVLRAVIWPARLLPLRNSGLFQLLGQLEAMLLTECDYLAEAERQKAFHELFARAPGIRVPAVLAANAQAIVAEWLDGKELLHCLDQPDSWFVTSYLKFVLVSLGRLGMVHADPHPGNFIITAADTGEKSLAVIDYGSVVIFNAEEKQALLRLLTGEYAHETALVDDLLRLGLEPGVLDMYRPILGDLVSILFEPFYYPGDYDFANWRVQYKLNTLMASRPWTKPLTAPLKLLLLMRTVQGLYYYARKASAVINWHRAVRKYLRQVI